MKKNTVKILVTSTALALSGANVAHAEDDSAILTNIVKKAGEAYLIGYSEKEATKAADEYFVKHLKDKTATYGSQLLDVYSKTTAAISLGQNLRNYPKAKDEESRYYTAMDGVTSALVFTPLAPAVEYIELSLLSQRVVSGYIGLQAQKEVEDRLRVAEEINTQTYQIRLARAHGEQAYLASLWATTSASVVEAKNLEKDYEQSCQKLGDDVTVEYARECLRKARNINYLNDLSANLVLELLHPRLEVLSGEKMLKDAGLDADQLNTWADQLKDVHARGAEHLDQLEEQMRELEIESRKEATNRASAPANAALACLTFTNTLADLWHADFSSPADRAFLAIQEKSYRADFDANCRQLDSHRLPARTVKYVAEIDRRLSALEAQLQSSSQPSVVLP